MRAFLAAAAIVCLAAPAAAQNAKALKGAAERALVKERFCDAVHLYTKLDDIAPEPDNLIAAAEAADRADDRARAVALYKAFVGKAPKHPRARAAERAVTDLEKRIARSGNGSACAVPAAECGNGLVEAGEGCDDGNTLDGDTCPRTCLGGSRTPVAPVVTPPAKVTAPVVTPPVVTPPVVTPPKVEPPKVEPPKVEPPKVEPPKVEPPKTEAGGTELCTLIKPVKIFVKGEWKTIDFGSTVTIKNRGVEFSKVESPFGEGKVSTNMLETACAKEDDAPAAEPVKTETSKGLTFEEPTPVTPAKEEPKPVVLDEPKEEPKVDPPREEPKEEPKVEEPKVEEPKVEAPKEALRAEGEPANEAPEVEEGGGGLGGWVMLGVGGAMVAGGATAGTFGALPFFQRQALCGASIAQTNACPAQAALADDYISADLDDRPGIAQDAEDLKSDVDNAAQEWDDRGRWLLVAGGSAAAVGAVLAIIGVVVATAGGEEEEEEEAE